MKLSFVARKVNGKLVPVDLHGDEELARLKEGTEVYIECVNFVPATLKQMRTAWWLATKLWENDPYDRFNRIKWKGQREALEYFMVVCRFAETRISSATGSTIVMPKSLRDLTREEMSVFINCALTTIEEELGVEHPELMRELTEALRASD